MAITTLAHIISHTHWDREWYLNSRYTNPWLLPFFEALFRMLEKEPAYRFVLDGQTSMIEDWLVQLETRGEPLAPYRQKLASYVRQGRLLVGPYYLQPDWQLVSEEALVRNLLIGRQMAGELGEVMNAGWLLDNFGQISQAPQIHREFGLDGLFLWRGVEMDPSQIQSEFTWESPDGSRVMAIYLVASYRNAMRLAEYPQALAGRIRHEIEKLSPFAATPNVLLMNGYDQEMQPDDILPYLKEKLPGLDDVLVRQSTPEEYLDAVKRAAPQLTTLHGALYSGRYISVFPGVLSSRMYLKILNDACQKSLEKYAEPLSALAWCMGQEYPADSLHQAWKLLLKNHPHDSICGVSIDDVHSDMEERYAASEKISQELITAAFSGLANNIDTSGHFDMDQCWVIANTSLVPYAGVLEIPGARPDRIFIDSRGKRLPCQWRQDGLAVIYVPEIAGLGYQTIYTIQSQSADSQGVGETENSIKPLQVKTGQNSIENEFFQVSISPDGSMTLGDKINQVAYPGLAVFEDCADAGDTYNYSYPERDQVITIQDQNAEITFLEAGPLRARVKIRLQLQIPEALAADRKERSPNIRPVTIVSVVTVEAGSPLVKFATQVINPVKDHRLRVLFPSYIQTCVSQAEVQFDVVEHPITPLRYDDSTIPPQVRQVIIGAREPRPVTIFPQRTFVDLSDEERGLAVINQGLPEYEILPEKNTIALTLFRSVGWIARPDLLARTGDAGPMIAVPGAQCLRRLEFHYAAYPHSGGWQSGGVLPQAERFNAHLVGIQSGAHPGRLKAAGGFFQLIDSQGALKVTAVKRSEDGKALIIRLHNPTPADVEGRIASFFQVQKAFYTGLGEDRREVIDLDNPYEVPVSAPGKKILTLRLEIERRALLEAEKGITSPFFNANGVAENDFEEIDLPHPITRQAIVEEGSRAAKLETILNTKRAQLEVFSSKIGAVDPTTALEFYRLQLEVASHQRTALEARLSEILLQKNYGEGDSAGNPGEPGRKAEYEAAIRRIGDEINGARVKKRGLEYVVDYYTSQVASDPEK